MPNLLRIGPSCALLAGSLAISACATKAPPELPPDPGPATATPRTAQSLSCCPTGAYCARSQVAK